MAKIETNADDESKKSSFINVKQEKPDLRKKEQPLIDVKVTNPITYIKTWWRRIIGNEGFELRIKVKPLTAIAITIIVLTVSLGIGRFKLPFKVPFFEYSLKEEYIPEISFRETAFVGDLRLEESSEKYFLLTESSEAINLLIPENVKLNDFLGRRIFATGKYYENERTLEVISASDLELLPKEVEMIPTIVPSSTPEPTEVIEPTEIPTSFPTLSPTIPQNSI